MPPNTIRRIDLFVFLRYTMKITGMYPLELWSKANNGLYYLGQFLDKAYELFTYFVSIHLAVLHIIAFYIYFHEGNLELLVNCLIQTVIYIWANFMKVYFGRVRRKLLKEILDNINLNYQLRSANGFTYVTMDEAAALSTRYSRMFSYWSYLGTAFWLILPIAYGDKSLPLNRCWYPFDYRKPYVYEAVYFLQSVGQIHMAAACASSSSMFMTLSILLAGQYDVLFCSLKNIFATSYIYAGAKREDLLRLNEAQQIADAELNQYYCSKEHTCAIETLIAEQTGQGSRAKDFTSAFKRALEECIQHQRYILGVLEQIERYYNPIWFFKIGEVTFLVCLVTFLSVKSTAESSFMRKVSLWQYLVLMLLELLIICYFADVVHRTSECVGSAVLRSPWYLHMRETRRDLLFFLEHSQRPFKLTAGKIYSLNGDRFRNTVTTAFSFFTLLQKLDKRRGISKLQEHF